MHKMMVVGRWAGSLAIILLLVCGCAKTKGDPARFVGVWEEVVKEGTMFKTTLELRGDGQALRTNLPDPHTEELAWYLKGDKLVLAPKNTTKPTRYDYRFNSPDELVLIFNGKEAVLKRKAAEP